MPVARQCAPAGVARATFYTGLKSGEGQKPCRVSASALFPAA